MADNEHGSPWSRVPTIETYVTPTAARLPPHGHEEVHVCLLLRGTMLERSGPGEVALLVGQARISPSGDEHRIRFGRDGGHCVLIFVPQLFLRDLTLKAPRERDFLTTGWRPSYLSSALDRRDAPLKRLVAQEIVAELLFDGASRPFSEPGPPPWLSRVRDRLRDDPGSVTELRQLALEADVHPGHLTRAFRAHFGCSPSAYLRWRRLVAARRLLSESRRRLVDIAHNCGFADQPHMTRWFRRLLGTTPAEIRTAAR